MAFDAFMKIDGIPGESQDDKHRNEIDVLSFHWGATQSGKPAARGGGAGTGKVNVQDLRVMKFTDAATPLLFLAVCQGEHIRNATLTLRKAGEKPLEYLQIKMTDVIISSVAPAGSAGAEADKPLEEVSLNFATVEIEYTPQKADGSPGTPVKASC